MPSAGFEPAIPATKLPQTYALDRAVTGIGKAFEYRIFILWLRNFLNPFPQGEVLSCAPRSSCFSWTCRGQKTLRNKITSQQLV
jgi:hypothetical protein